MMISGCYDKIRGTYRMHSPSFPYNSILYVGYSERQMKRKYREDNNLRGRHIEWIIVGK